MFLILKIQKKKIETFKRKKLIFHIITMYLFIYVYNLKIGSYGNFHFKLKIMFGSRTIMR